MSASIVLEPPRRAARETPVPEQKRLIIRLDRNAGFAFSIGAVRLAD